MVRRMAADFHTCVLKRTQIIPCKIAVLTNIVCHHIEHGLHAPFTKHRQNDTRVVLIAIIKGEDHGFFGKLLLALACPRIILRRDGRIAFCREIIQLCRKVRRCDGIWLCSRTRVLRDHMVL